MTKKNKMIAKASSLDLKLITLKYEKLCMKILFHVYLSIIEN